MRKSLDTSDPAPVDRRVAVTALGGLLLLLTPLRSADAQALQDSAGRVVLAGVTVFDGTGGPARPNQSVLIEGERIAAIFPTGSRRLPPAATVHDLTGRYLVPGLIDTHVHVATDPSGEDSRVRTERRLRRALLGGVTAVRDMAGDVRALAALQRDALVGDLESPDIYYAALFAGPAFFADPRTHDAARGLTPGQVPWMRAITDTTDLVQAVAEARGTGATAIKLYADLSGELARRITDEAHRQRMMVWAHAALWPAGPAEVVEAGVNAVSHASLIALAMDSARHDALFAAMVRRRTVLEPSLLIVTDSAPMLRLAAAITKEAHGRGITVAAGTDTLGSADAGAVVLPNLHRELELLVTLAGLSPAQALESATRHAAAVLGADQLRGTIEAGKLADLVVLRADPLVDIRNTRSIELVMRRGRVVRSHRPGEGADHGP